MRIKSLALATTLSLLSTSALVGTVHAQKGVTLQPQSNWAVKRVNAGSSDSYCALARRFKQDMILTLAKNDKHEISFAIDFPQGRFVTSQRYEITLDPGAGEQRKFKVSPAGSGKAFVLRVGSDQKFMSALLRTGYLRVVVDNESYNFNLADIDQGQEKLNACLYSGMTPAAGGDDTLSVSSHAQVANLRAEKEKLEQRLKKLEQENENLRLQSATTEQKIASKDKSLASDAALKVTHSPAVAGLRAQIESLKNENAELKKLAKDNTPKSKDVSVIELARENQRLQNLLQEQGNVESYKREIEQLTQRVSSLESENLALAQQKPSGINDDERKDLERQIMALNSENDALRKSIERQETAKSSDVTALKQEISGLERDNAQLNTRISTLMQEKSNVIDQLSYYETENDKLRDAATKTSSDTTLLSQLREEIRRIEGRNARLLAQKETEISALQSDLQALEKEKANLAETSQEAMHNAEEDFKARIAALDIKNEALKEELVLLSKDQTILDDFRAKVDGLEQEKTVLQGELETAHARISDLQQKIDGQKTENAGIENEKLNLNKEVSDLEAEIDSLHKSISNLSLENEGLQADLLARSEARKQLIENHEQELASLKAENKSLKDQLADYQSEDIDKVAVLLKENEQLRNQLQTLESQHLDKVTALEESLKQLKKANAVLHDDAERKSASLEEELVKLRDQLAQANDEETTVIDAKNQNIASLQESVRKLESENKDLVMALENANRFNQTLQNDWAETLEAYNNLEKEYETDGLAQNEVDNGANTERAEREKRLEALQAQNKELKKQLEAQAREYLVLVRDMEALKQGGAGENAQSAAISTEKMEALRKDNEVLRGEIGVLRDKLVSRGSPQAREAALKQGESALNSMDNEARRKRDSELQQRQHKAQREVISRLAATEPAAGGGDAAISDEKQHTNTNSRPVDIAQRDAVQDVIKDMHDTNLTEAQKLERSLKKQIERSAHTSTENSRSTESFEKAPNGTIAMQGVDPNPPVMKESLEDEHHKTVAVVKQDSNDALFTPNVNVAELLAAANIDLAVPVALVSNSSGADRVAYQWRSANDLYGSAHQKKISNINEFDSYVRDYLTMTEERCGGDFAIIPSSTDQVGQTRIDSYEIACVGNGVNSSASVVFFNKDDTFTVLAHEGPTEGMEMAMDARDKIVSTVDKT